MENWLVLSNRQTFTMHSLFSLFPQYLVAVFSLETSSRLLEWHWRVASCADARQDGLWIGLDSPPTSLSPVCCTLISELTKFKLF